MVRSGNRNLFLIWVLGVCCFVAAFFLVPLNTNAQYKGDHIPGFSGLESGTQAPPGVYIGALVWVYSTDTVKDSNGNNVQLPGSLTSSAPMILASVVTNYKLFGANIGVSAGFPFMKNRIQTDSLDVSTSLAYTDMSVGATLGWHLKRADVTAGYNLYIPTGNFSPNGNDNTGLGMWANEVTLGSTVFLDEKKSWSLAATFAAEFNSNKHGTNIRPGDLGTVEGGFGKTFYKKVDGPIPMIFNIGAAYYAQFKMSGDSGSDIPPVLQGFKDRVFALGPEASIFIPKPRLTFDVRYGPEFGARVRTEGQTVVVSVVWVAKSLIKMP